MQSQIKTIKLSNIKVKKFHIKLEKLNKKCKSFDIHRWKKIPVLQYQKMKNRKQKYKNINIAQLSICTRE